MREQNIRTLRHRVSNLGALLLVAIAISLLIVSCGGDDAVEASQQEGDPPGVASATLVVSEGSFEADKLIVSTSLATKLTIQNEDNVAYTFKIENLVDGKVIGAAGDTVVDFTSPTAGEFEASIAGPNGEDEDMLTVEVE